MKNKKITEYFEAVTAMQIEKIYIATDVRGNVYIISNEMAKKVAKGKMTAEQFYELLTINN